MTSLNGYDTGFSSISENYLYLAPTCTDNIYGTSINYCNLVRSKGIWDGQEKNPKVLKEYSDAQQAEYTFMNKHPQKVKSGDTNWSVIDLIEKHPRLTEYRKILKLCPELKKKFHEAFFVTLFVPNDSAFKRANWIKQLKNDSVFGLNTYNARAVTLLKSHALDFTLGQEVLMGRNTMVNTMNEPYTFYIDGTGQIARNLVVYNTPTKLRDGITYPKPYAMYNIVESYITDNGNVFVIDGVLEPFVI
jgi:hypothetical protein